MQNAGRGEGHAAGFDKAVLAIACNFQTAITNEQELRVGMAMRRMRHLTRWKRGLVHLNILASGQCSADNRARLSAIDGSMNRQTGKGKEL
jgi:hypothetical protein